MTLVSVPFHLFNVTHPISPQLLSCILHDIQAPFTSLQLIYLLNKNIYPESVWSTLLAQWQHFYFSSQEFIFYREDKICKLTITIKCETSSWIRGQEGTVRIRNIGTYLHDSPVWETHGRLPGGRDTSRILKSRTELTTWGSMRREGNAGIEYFRQKNLMLKVENWKRSVVCKELYNFPVVWHFSPWICSLRSEVREQNWNSTLRTDSTNWKVLWNCLLIFSRRVLWSEPCEGSSNEDRSIILASLECHSGRPINLPTSIAGYPGRGDKGGRGLGGHDWGAGERVTWPLK